MTWHISPILGRLAARGQVLFAAALFAAIAFSAPEWVPDRFAGSVALILIYAIVTWGLAVVLGYSGQFILSQGAVYATGAYTSALLATRQDWPVWGSMAAGVVMGAAVGTLLGLPALRLRSHYVALVTFGFAVVTPQLLRVWKPLTGGFAGVPGIPRPSIGSHTLTADEYYYVLAAACVLVLWIVSNLLRSRWRTAFLAVHDDEVAAAAAGIPVQRVKLVAFVLASALGALGGALYASYVGFVSPDTFGLEVTLLLLVAVVVGGPRSILGPLLGSTFFVILPQVLSSVREYNLLIYSLLLMATPRFFPDGFMEAYERVLQYGMQKLRWRIQYQEVAPLTAEAIPIAPLADSRANLNVRELQVTFGGVVAVDGVSISVPAGTVQGLIGPNGSGKTTLLNAVSGFVAPTAGTIFLRGERIDRLMPHERAVRGIGRSFQTPRIFEHMSVLENVTAGMFHRGKATLLEVLLGLPRSLREYEELLTEAEVLLQAVGLHGKRGMPAVNLPIVQRKLLEIARALALRPSVLLLDEPSAGLAPHKLAEFAQFIRMLRERGYSVILVAHQADMVFQVADTVTVLDGGKVIAAGDPQEVRASERVIQSYLGQRY